MRYLDEYEGISLKVFFDKFTDSANKLPQSVLDDYQHVFEQTIKLVYDIYGEQAFACISKYRESNNGILLVILKKRFMIQS